MCVILAKIYEKKKDYKNVCNIYTRAVEKHPSDLSKEEMASARKGIQNAHCKTEAEKQKEQRMAKKQQKTLPASSHA